MDRPDFRALFISIQVPSGEEVGEGGGISAQMSVYSSNGLSGCSEYDSNTKSSSEIKATQQVYMMQAAALTAYLLDYIFNIPCHHTHLPPANSHYRQHTGVTRG